MSWLPLLRVQARMDLIALAQANGWQVPDKWYDEMREEVDKLKTPQVQTASRTVVANPAQPLEEAIDLGGWTWGEEWRLGRQRGRWAIYTNKLLPNAAKTVRVRWSKRVAVKGAWYFEQDLDDAFRDPDTSAATVQAARQEGRDHSERAARLWSQEQQA